MTPIKRTAVKKERPHAMEFWNRSVNFIQIRYTDIIGKFRSRYLSKPDDVEAFFKYGIGLDGSSVKGFADIHDSDLLLLPDRSTAKTLPNYGGRVVGTVIADVYKGFAQGRLNADPRYASQKMQTYLDDNNMVCQLGPEVECFVFDEIKSTSGQQPEIVSSEQESSGKYPIMQRQGYDCPPFQDSLAEFRFQVADILKEYYSIDVTNLNHEVASSGQIEINFIHDTLTRAADNVQIFKDVIRNVAKQHGKIATFMPKPIFDDDHDFSKSDNGSGMHVNVSLWRKSPNRRIRGDSNDKNIFYDKDDEYAELSQSGRYFIGGILDHAVSLMALVAPTINSYHRLIPGFEAPTYIAWAKGNRSAVIRVPVVERNSAKSKRIEFRAPDPSANPYLALSAIVAAGLDGIAKKKEPSDPVDENIYKLPDSKRSEIGIKALPASLEEAVSALKNDQDYLLRHCFNSDLLESYLNIKEEEIREGSGKGKAWQIRHYYDV